MTYHQITSAPKSAKAKHCGMCDDMGYSIGKGGDYVQGQWDGVKLFMKFCGCKRGQELELLVEAEKGKAYERGQRSVRGDNL